MSRCQYVCNYYNVPADIGRRVIINGKPGIIAADRGNYIGVNFDSDKPGVIMNAHPTYGVEYLEMGTIRKMTRSQQRYQRYLEFDFFESFKQFLQCPEFWK
jgi:hypothetical protein